ncbi:Phenol degradation protein meta [Paraburkholderia tropica]
MFNPRLYAGALSIALLSQVPAHALENGSTSYPAGIMTVMSGLVGAPGNYVYSYNKFENITSLRDGNGNANPPGANGGVQAHALRLVHVFDQPTLFGGNIAIEAAIPYIDGTLHLPAYGISGGGRGFGDPLFGVLIGWQSQSFFQNVELDMVVPTGSYQANRLFNPGNNVTSGYLAYSFTWFPLRQLEISSKINLNYSSVNSATHYQSGLQLTADYGINYHINQTWLVGVGGYANTQLNDDKINGQSAFGDGHRTHEITVGPQVGYGTQKWGGMISWQQHVYARNAAYGNALWVNAYYKF